MNNKGFAITTILYGTMILFLLLLVSMLGILASYKDRLSLFIDSNNGARNIINRGTVSRSLSRSLSLFSSNRISDYIVYDESDSSFVGNFQPTVSFCQGVNTTLSFYKMSQLADTELYATLHMDIDSIGSNIAKSSNVYWVITKGDNNISCSSGLSSSSVLGYGTFSGKKAGDEVILKTDMPVTTEKQTFTVWFWKDSSGSDISSISGETIDANIWIEFQVSND